MAKEEVNPGGKNIRDLAGTGEQHVMGSAEEKKLADRLLAMTPAELASIVVSQPVSPEAVMIELMVTRDILNAAQCALLAAEIANRYEDMTQVEAVRSKDRSLTTRIFQHATGTTRTRLQEILTPRVNDDGSLDALM